MTARRLLLATGLCVVALSAVIAVFWWRSANVGPVQRGADLAAAQGCLGCHAGPGASPQLPRAFADLDDVDAPTLREWILDGMPQRVRQDPERRDALEAAAIRMPAWRGRLSPAQVDDLIAYVRALAAVDVADDPASRKGHAVAERLGCFRCHGPGGRGAGRNPGSLKGYIPPWDGRDFAELVENERELREWILDGRPQRLQANRLARFFLDRQAIRMPAFRGQIDEEDLRALEAYIGSLRPASPVPRSGRSSRRRLRRQGTADATPRTTSRPDLSAVVAALRVSPHAADLTARPSLIGRLRATPRSYFRFVARPFTQAVCDLFEDARDGFPDVNLHGDAHLEQYAVTSIGRGLTDFDESARGPSFIDLVRFGVSLELAAREKNWPGEGRHAFGAFLGGYREALKNPDINKPSPRVVTRARRAFARDHRLALRRADAIIDADPVPASEIEADSRRYAVQMAADCPGMPTSFFTIKKAGRQRLGIGSALDEKFLFRIEGWSKEADDDEILEAKLVRPLSEVDCVRPEQGPERVPLGMALIAYAPFPFSGLFTRRGRTFWVHGWTDDYMELSIDSSFASREDLRQVAYDVGIQLGRAHPKEVAGEALRPGLRGILLQATHENEGRIRETIDELAEATVRAWMAFRHGTGT